MKIKLIILVLLLFAAHVAESYTISGVVTDESGEPLLGALVTRIGAGMGGDNAEYTITDIDGQYTIDSGPSEHVVVIAEYASFISAYKVADGPVVNLKLKEMPDIPVDFFKTLMQNSALLELTISGTIHNMGYPHLDFNMFFSDNELFFILSTNKSTSPGYDINGFADTTVKGYLQQMKASGELNTFLSQMQSSDSKWIFAIYSTATDTMLNFKEFDAQEIRKLL